VRTENIDSLLDTNKVGPEVITKKTVVQVFYFGKITNGI
jgi:hypothetical protein